MSDLDPTSPTPSFDHSMHPSPPGPGSRKLWLLWLLGAGVLVVLCVWLVHYLSVGRYLETTNDAYLQADAVTIAPRISGYVKQVYVTDNQTVAVGAPLFDIDDRPYAASLHQAQAALAARQADLVQAKAACESQRAALAQARSQVTVAQASLDFATEQVKRFSPLLATGADSSEHVESLKHTLERARAEQMGAQAQRSSNEQLVHVAEARIQQAEAAVLAAGADVDQARISLDDTHVISALAGRVGDKKIQIGQFVSPGMPTMTIVPMHAVYLIANFKETQVGRMRRGMPVSLRIDAFDDRVFHGVIESISPGTGAQFALFPPENATGNFTKVVQRVPVRIQIDTDAPTRQLLLPGLSVEATVDTRDQGDEQHHASVVRPAATTALATGQRIR